MNLRWSYGFSIMIDAALYLALGITALTLFLNMNLLYGEAILVFYILFSLMTFYMVLSPLQFKNASLGMKLMGLRIVDIKGGAPSRRAILSRSLSIIAIAKEDWPRILCGEDMDGVGLRSTGTQIVFATGARGEASGECAASELAQKAPLGAGRIAVAITSLVISIAIYMSVAVVLPMLGDFSVFGESVSILLAPISIISILLAVICPYIILRGVAALMR